MSSSRLLKTSIRVISSTTIVDLEGSIDIGNSPGLRSSLLDSLQKTSRLALNMSGIRYIDSSGIATLIEVLKKARDLKKDFLLFGVAGAVHDVLKMTNLLGVFQIVNNEEQALGSHGS
jgi:anti-sigma B factor antagonist